MKQEKYEIGIIELGMPVPGSTAELAYYDSMRAKRLPAILIQPNATTLAHAPTTVQASGVYSTLIGKRSKLK